MTRAVGMIAAGQQWPWGAYKALSAAARALVRLHWLLVGQMQVAVPNAEALGQPVTR